MRDNNILYDITNLIETSCDTHEATYSILLYFTDFLQQIKCDESSERLLQFVREEFENNE